jgi:hypothetical protein
MRFTGSTGDTWSPVSVQRVSGSMPSNRQQASVCIFNDYFSPISLIPLIPHVIKPFYAALVDCLHTTSLENQHMERHLQRAIRTAMLAFKSSPYLIVGCAITAIVFLLSLRSYGVAGSAPSTWRLSNQPPVSRPLKGNFNSASAGREDIDTTSEIGRASNSTLGVCAL